MTKTTDYRMTYISSHKLYNPHAVPWNQNDCISHLFKWNNQPSSATATIIREAASLNSEEFYSKSYHAIS